MLNIGIIGIGNWGMNCYRALNEIGRSNVKWVCSRTQESIDKALEILNIGEIKTTVDYKEILADEEVDAVIIATNANVHFQISMDALNSGKHIMVEKPVAFKSSQIQELIDKSKEVNKVFMAGHNYKYNSGILKLKEDISRGEFGDLKYIKLSHLNSGPPRSDMNALWDFAPHFIYTLNFLLDEVPKSVSVNGFKFMSDDLDDFVNIKFKFSGLTATANCGWIFTDKRMELMVFGDKKFGIFNDHLKENKLKYVNKEHKGEFIAIDSKMPLTVEIEHFLDCIEKGLEPRTGGEEALMVTKVLEFADESLKNNGEEVEIK